MSSYWKPTSICSYGYIEHSGKEGMKWGYTDGQRNGKRTAQGTAAVGILSAMDEEGSKTTRTGSDYISIIEEQSKKTFKEIKNVVNSPKFQKAVDIFLKMHGIKMHGL